MSRGPDDGAAGVRGYILAGGRARRFGSDKARATLDDVPLVLRCARALSPWVETVTAVVDRPGKYADLGLACLCDPVPGQGPLGGLAGALQDLQAAGGHTALVVSCDLLELRRDWLEQLLSPALQGCAAYRGAVSWQPFPGRYTLDVLPELTARLARGQRALQPFLATVATPLPLPADWPQVVQANRPEDLDAYAQQRTARTGGPTDPAPNDAG